MGKKQPKRKYCLGGNRHAAQDKFFVAALDKDVWQEGDAEHWDTCWYTGMPDADVFERLTQTKTVNHINGNNALTIKNYLHETLSNARNRLKGSEFEARMNFFPRVYDMPDDYHKLQQAALETPEQNWLLKPKNSSRGRGIELLEDSGSAPLDAEFMVQAYLDNPHLMHGRKYVLRLYVLITSLFPLRVYLHEEGFAKLASELYSIEDPDNPFTYLTNPDINATNLDADAPVEFVNQSAYRDWLAGEGEDADGLFEKIRDLVTLTVIAASEKMRARTLEMHAPGEGCYELLGVDVMVDGNLKPWLLECNLSPSLEVCADADHGGRVERQVKKSMVADMVGILGLNEVSSNDAYPDMREKITAGTDAEQARAGGFSPLFPAAETALEYLRAFPVPIYHDIVAAEHSAGQAFSSLLLAPRDTFEVMSDTALSLYHGPSGQLFTPDELAGWIWLKAADGEDPNAIAAELIASQEQAQGKLSADDKFGLMQTVWDLLAGWAHLGLLGPQQNSGHSGESEEQQTAQTSQPLVENICVGAQNFCLEYGAPAVATRLSPLFSRLRHEDMGKKTRRIRVHCANEGYALTADADLLATGLRLDEIGQYVVQAVFARAAICKNDIALAGTVVLVSETEVDLFVSEVGTPKEAALAVLVASRQNTGFSGGALLNLKTAQITPLALPVRVDEADYDLLKSAGGTELPICPQSWPNETERHRQGSLVPASLKPQGCYKLRKIYVCSRQNERTEPASLIPANLHGVLALLLQTATPVSHNHPDLAQVEGLNTVLTRVNLLYLAYENPEEVLSIID